MTTKKRVILIADDEEGNRKLFSMFCAKMGCDVLTANNGKEAVEKTKKHLPDLIIMDLNMPIMDGFIATENIRNHPSAEKIPIIIISAASQKESIMAGISKGANDYLVKPVEFGEFSIRIGNQLEQAEKAKDNYVYKSKRMLEIFELVRKVAATDSLVLLTGESGTGKEMITRAIHDAGKRKDKSFVVVDCGAIADSLLENELFGHEKGAYTGATSLKKGLCESADGGTLFIDEIGDVNINMQAKLLRLLETSQFRRLGGTEMIKINIRIIAATNKNLEEEVKKGNFRQDLYYRLKVFTIELPPLRERKEIIPFLALQIIKNTGKEAGKKMISYEALEFLMKYSWPGNIREFKNAIEYALIVSDGKSLQPKDLPKDVVNSEESRKMPLSGGSLQKRLDEYEKQIIVELLKEHSLDETAKLLELSKPTLYRKLLKYKRRSKPEARQELKTEDRGRPSEKTRLK